MADGRGRQYPPAAMGPKPDVLPIKLGSLKRSLPDAAVPLVANPERIRDHAGWGSLKRHGTTSSYSMAGSSTGMASAFGSKGTSMDCEFYNENVSGHVHGRMQELGRRPLSAAVTDLPGG